jgi:hypothetical protein
VGFWVEKWLWDRFCPSISVPPASAITPTAPYSSSIIRGNSIGQILADEPSGLNLTPPHEIRSEALEVRETVKCKNFFPSVQIVDVIIMCGSGELNQVLLFLMMMILI